MKWTPVYERGRLDRQAPGHFAHRRQQRQAAALVGHGLVGDRYAARLDQAARLFGVGCEVQVGEQDLAFAQHLPLHLLRLLDLDDHLGRHEHLGGTGNDACTGGHVGRVIGTEAGAGAGLHQHLVPGRGEIGRAHV